MKNREIERKWLMEGFPALAHEAELRQVQGYLCFEPSTVRIRKTTDSGAESCVLTIKGKGMMSRTEVEVSLDQAQYDVLVPLLAAPMAQKRLRTYALPGGHMLECSLVDEGEADAFYYAEVEFESEEAAKNFAPPAWLGREVTEEPGFTMASRCRAKRSRVPDK